MFTLALLSVASPRSMPSASPGPFATRRVTCTFTGVLIAASFCRTSVTRLIRSI
jgi:hypothetical protein